MSEPFNSPNEEIASLRQTVADLTEQLALHRKDALYQDLQECMRINNQLKDKVEKLEIMNRQSETWSAEKLGIENEDPLLWQKMADYAHKRIAEGEKWMTISMAQYAGLLQARQNDRETVKENQELRDALERTREALVSTTAHLVAATSLLEAGGKSAAASDKIFYKMLNDYRTAANSAARVHAGMEKKP